MLGSTCLYFRQIVIVSVCSILVSIRYQRRANLEQISTKIEQMNTYQIHIRLTPQLKQLLKKKCGGYGLTPAQYVKYILIKDLNLLVVDLNRTSFSERNKILNEVFNK